MPESISTRAPFHFLRYANCWEDADVLCEALRPDPQRRILSIGSGGDNTFSLLAHGAKVIAVDLNLSQLACIALKGAAIRRLDYDELLGFIGVRPHSDRLEIYRLIKGDLNPHHQEFWDAHLETVEHGLVHAGKFERYFQKFRRFVMPCVHSKARVSELLRGKSAEDRKWFYEKRWNNLRWRLLFRVFFSRFVMGRLGRDPEFFRYVEGSVSDRILARTEYALTVLPTDANPYLHYILTGNFSNCHPHYLHPDRIAAARENMERLTLFHGTVQEAAAKQGHGGFDGYNLSDIFEYLSSEQCEAIYRTLLQQANPGARFAYWNMLVPRRLSENLSDQVRFLEEESLRLFRRDRAFFYSRFIIEEVQP